MNIELILTLFTMQDEMNKKVHPEWVDQNFAWHRAIYVEAGELADHYGWKWWKHQEPDLEQVKIELVDIFHFGLSMFVADYGINGSSAARLSDLMDRDNEEENLEFFDALDMLISEASAGRFGAGAFSLLMQCVGMTEEELYETYVAKNVLNFFRQDNGYKSGEYVKIWDGKEDNEHLAEIVKTLDSSKTTFKDDLYGALTDRYNELTLAG